MASGDSLDTDLVPASARAPQPEQRLFGRFTLKRVLGRGGMGIVWLASDEELQRNVAMKFLPDMLIRDPDAVKDLKRETRRSLDLTHHHIVRIYDFIQDDSSAAIVMEYVDGESLSGMKSKQPGGCFGPSEIAHWVAHFCMAMDYAHHQARVVHRDLKPANLMVNSRSEMKVTDFGISRSLSDSMTRVSLANNAGTLAYMSPEQALGSPPAPADDIYAFGATLYDLLTGRPPFFRGNLQIQLETVLPPPLMQRRKELDNTAEDVPSDWEEVIMACLSKRPEDRPGSLGEVGMRLGLLGATGARPTPSSSTGDIIRVSSPTTATTRPGGDTEMTVHAPRMTTSVVQNTAPATRLEDILGEGVDRSVEPVHSAPAPPPTSRTATEVLPPPLAPAAPPTATAPPPAPTTAGTSRSVAPTATAIPLPPADVQPPTFPGTATSSPEVSYSPPVASPSRGGKPWLWIGIAAVVVVAVAAAIAWPKGDKSVKNDPAPQPPIASGPTPAPAPAPEPVQPPPVPDPVVVEAERLANSAQAALDGNDLPTAKREIAALRERKPDYAALASLTTRLETAEKEAQQTAFNGYTAAAENAIEKRNIPAARDAIDKAAAINKDDPRIASLRLSLAKLESPPATPAPIAAAPQPSTPVTKSDPDPPKKSTTSTKRSEPRTRKEEPPTKRVTARSEPAPEPPRPQQTRPPPAAPQPAPTTSSRPEKSKKVFSVPGS